jgi:glycosyl transferase family 92
LREMTEEQAKPYLSICAIYRDEAPYLQEWIEFHRLVGVERFFLYDNLSVDDHREVLAPYIDEGVVVLHDWPISYMAQRPAYEHCLYRHRDDSRWIAFLDLDEFLFSPTGSPVSDLLREYEQWPGVGVYWAIYGTSGHTKRPEGLVIENYLERMNPNRPGNAWFRQRKYMKSIVDPRRTARCRALGAHNFEYMDGTAVDENKQPITRGYSQTLSYSRLRVNHYYTKSEEEDRARRESTVRADYGTTRRVRSTPAKRRFLDRELNQERDEAITVYVPALRRALGMRA